MAPNGVPWGAGGRAHTPEQARPRAFPADHLTSLPTDIVLAHLLPRLSAASLTRFPRLCRATHALWTDAADPHVNAVWRSRVAADWGAATAAHFDAPGKKTDWEAVYRLQYNVERGIFHFRTVAEPKGLAKRAARQLVMEREAGGDAHFGIAIPPPREVEVTVGQPTIVETGYAVNLRLLQPYILHIHGPRVALASTKDPFLPPRYLPPHGGTVVALATCGSLAATAGEDMLCRVYDFSRISGGLPKLVAELRAGEVLDVALYGNRLVTYDNSNVVRVFELGPDIAQSRSSGAEVPPDRAPDAVLDLGEVVRRYLALIGQPASNFAPDDEPPPPLPSPYPPLDPTTLQREVKIALCADLLVCGFENTHFLVVDLGPDPSRHLRSPPGAAPDGTPRFTLRQMHWPLLFHLHDPSPLSSLDAPQRGNLGTYASTSYPTVLHLSPAHLVARSPRANELLVFSLRTGDLLHRLSESACCLRAAGFLPPADNGSDGEVGEGLEVVTDFAYHPAAGVVLCTAEDARGDVLLHAYDFAPPARGGRRRRWRFEKRNLEWGGGGDGVYEYGCFWVGWRDP